MNGDQRRARLVGLYGAFMRTVPDERASWGADPDELQRRKAEALAIGAEMDELVTELTETD